MEQLTQERIGVSVKKITLVASLLIMSLAAKGQAQVYIQPASYSDTYTVTQQPVYTTTPQTYQPYAAPAAVVQPVAPNYAGGVYAQPVTYGNPCMPCPCVSPVSYQPAAAYQPVAAPAAAGCKPYYVGRGLLGQPKLYMPGQPVRNALRFITP
jgi:hypothetical protein